MIKVIRKNGRGICKRCGNRVDLTIDGEIVWSNFCHNCGSKLDWKHFNDDLYEIFIDIMKNEKIS